MASVVLFAFGCAVGVPAQPTAPPSSTASPAASPTDWGPLAVIPPQGGTDTARTEGVLRIGESCVVLETPGDDLLLLWPADQTTWDADTRTITFRNEDGAIQSVGDGASIVLGGSGDSNEESGTTTEAWLASIDWVARPTLSCRLIARWFVGHVSD